MVHTCLFGRSLSLIFTYIFHMHKSTCFEMKRFLRRMSRPMSQFDSAHYFPTNWHDKINKRQTWQRFFCVWVKFVSNQIFCHKIISIIIIIINLIVITIVPLIRNEHPDEYCLSRKNHEHIYIMQIDTAKTVQNAKRLWSKRFGFLFVSFFFCSASVWWARKKCGKMYRILIRLQCFQSFFFRAPTMILCAFGVSIRVVVMRFIFHLVFFSSSANALHCIQKW